MQELTSNDLTLLLQFTVDLAQSAGAIILTGSKEIQRARSAANSAKVNEKKNAVDLVTEWDVKVENFVRESIEKKYPSFQFIGEESFAGGKHPPLTDDPTFCVDPIDGTTNFIHGFPFSCISIGFIYKKQPTIGVVCNPFLNQLFSALKGHGAFLNGVSIIKDPPPPFPSLQSALIGVEWGSDRAKDVVEKKAASFARLAGDPRSIERAKMVHSLRSIGSAALNYCLVATGGLDIYWEIGCWPWDVCAGIVIAQETGGFVSAGHNSNHDGDITEELLWGRKYIVVRAVGDTQEEKGIDAQKRIVREFYATVDDWEGN